MSHIVATLRAHLHHHHHHNNNRSPNQRQQTQQRQGSKSSNDDTITLGSVLRSNEASRANITDDNSKMFRFVPKRLTKRMYAAAAWTSTGNEKKWYSREAVRQAYERPVVQGVTAVLIFANFAVNAARAQTSSSSSIFQAFETFFLVAFTIELAWNMYGLWFFEFWKNGWNVFDFLIVLVSILSRVLGNVPGIVVLRLFRAFRVFRLSRRIPSLKKIVEAVLASMTGVANAFVILVMLMGIWAIMGVEFFGREDSPYFGTFLRAMLTMWQMMTLDGWGDVCRHLVFDLDKPISAMFFISYIFATNIVMSNVVVAVLLDKFLANKASDDDDDDQSIIDDTVDQLLTTLMATNHQDNQPPPPPPQQQQQQQTQQQQDDQPKPPQPPPQILVQQHNQLDEHWQFDKPDDDDDDDISHHTRTQSQTTLHDAEDQQQHHDRQQQQQQHEQMQSSHQQPPHPISTQIEQNTRTFRQTNTSISSTHMWSRDNQRQYLISQVCSQLSSHTLHNATVEQLLALATAIRIIMNPPPPPPPQQQQQQLHHAQQLLKAQLSIKKLVPSISIGTLSESSQSGELKVIAPQTTSTSSTTTTTSTTTTAATTSSSSATMGRSTSPQGRRASSTPRPNSPRAKSGTLGQSSAKQPSKPAKLRSRDSRSRVRVPSKPQENDNSMRRPTA